MIQAIRNGFRAMIGAMKPVGFGRKLFNPRRPTKRARTTFGASVTASSWWSHQRVRKGGAR